MKSDDASVDVVLATYNGQKYICQFLESLSDQTFSDWRLVWRDDGSSDGTVEIVRSWASRRGLAVLEVDNNDGNLGIIENFVRCLEHTSANYVMFADQDDVWLPNKIEELYKEISKIEDKVAESVPVCVFCDLVVVDQDLKVVEKSMSDVLGLPHDLVPKLTNLLVQNVIPGCSMIFNRKLIEVALPIPLGVVMHDWWFALICSAVGRIGRVSEPLVLYRQHAGNQIGIKRRTLLDLFYELTSGGLRRARHRIAESRRQALLLSDHLPLGISQRAVVRRFVDLERLFPVARQFFAFRAGFYKFGKLRNLIFYILL